MQYLLTFLEGVISFISPCLLPMLPVYISYFAGEGGGEGNRRVWPRALAVCPRVYGGLCGAGAVCRGAACTDCP